MMRTTRVSVSRAFTLVEMLVVVAIMGVLAAVVVPGLGAMDQHSQEAGITELRRSLRYARAQAAASGAPTGVRVRSLNQARLDFVRLDPDTTNVVAVPGPLGNGLGFVRLDEEYSKFAITAMTNGDGTNGTDMTIWFDYEGVPHTRQADGTFVANFAQNAVVTVTVGSGSQTVRVYKHSGLIND